jgi:hypothetical protein
MKKLSILSASIIFSSLSVFSQTISGVTFEGDPGDYLSFNHQAESCYEPCYYWWEVEDPDFITDSETSMTAQWQESGIYRIKLYLYISACSCDILQDERDVKIGDPFRVQYQYDEAGNRISRQVVYLERLKSKSGKNEITDEFENPESIFKVFPNPATQSIYVGLNQDAIESFSKSISIYDLSGKEVISQIPMSDAILIDLSDLNSGVYILKLRYDNGSKECKIIKR